jgi:Baseplate J-like protein
LYVQLALIGDYDTLTEKGMDYMRQSLAPNWVDRPGNPETIMIESSGQIAAEVIDQASLVPPEALSAIGTSIYGIPMGGGTKATANAMITFDPSAPPVMVPMDAEVSVPHPSGSELVFLTDRDAFGPPGGGDIPVQLIALEASADYNGCFGTAELIEVTEGVHTVTLTSVTAGGTNPETAEEYLDRLTDYLTLPRRPVLPEDHAALALQNPAVGRATAYNLYYPGTTVRDAGRAVGDYDLWTPQPPPAAAQTPVARCTTVAIMGLDGTMPSLYLMEEVWHTLSDNREINFLNFVVSPTMTEVDVKCNVKPYNDTIDEDVIQSVKDTVSSWLNPEEFSQSPGVGGTWEAESKVRLYEAVDYINRAAGVWYCENVQLKLHSDSTWQTADITLPGLAPVPTSTPDNIFVTII